MMIFHKHLGITMMPVLPTASSYGSGWWASQHGSRGREYTHIHIHNSIYKQMPSVVCVETER